MINAKLRSRWNRLMAPVGRGLATTRISPNTVTAVGLVIQAGSAWLILDGRLLAAGLVAVVAGFFDAFDGAVARARGMTSRLGALIDSTTDRLADALVFLPIAWLYGVAPDISERAEPWVAAAALVALVASFLVSYVKARAESLGYECNVGIAERAERLIIVIAGLILDLVPPMLVLLAVLSVITFIQRIVHVAGQTDVAGT